MNNTSQKKVIPSHVAVIFDGNRRWARERNLSIYDGYLRGYEKVRDACDWFFLRGVKNFSVYVFAGSSWDREKKELDILMNLTSEFLLGSIDDFNKKDYKIIAGGRIDELPNDLPLAFEEALEKTKQGLSGTLNVCFNYGGRFELIDAIKKIVKNELTEEQIHEGIVKKYLYNPLLPDVDIIARTGGEHSLNDFLTWQSVNAELFFLKKYWPDFEELDVVNMLEEYNLRRKKF